MVKENELEKNPWTTLSSEMVYESAWIAVTKHDCINPAGNPATYSTVTFKNIAIGIIPLDNDLNTWLVGQWRYPLKQYSWEIVEGGGKLGVNPIESAKRELLEETGLVAQSYTQIIEMHLSNSVSDEYGIIYIAKGISEHQAEPEETEVLQVKKLPFLEAYNMVMNGEITDSLSVAGILKTKILLDQNKL
jgi:8-oxo-dGTP pyrophosphatase MutT (NUDIX family)